MLIPMEILSQMMTRADSGTGVRQRAGPSVNEGSRFDKVFDRAVEASRPQNASKNPDKAIAGKETAPAKPKDPVENTYAGEMAAGVMGNHKEVVFILEGDMESATNPETRVETYLEAGIISTEPATAEAKPEAPVAEAKTEPVAADENVKAVEIPADAAKAANTEKHAESTVTANVETTEKAKPELTNVENKTTVVSGEVTARTPIIRTSERQGKDESSASFSRNGGLSPLENENDTNPIKGQKEKAFSDTVAAVRDAAESAQEPVNNTLPLAEGIRPEQFRADQQMRQAAMDAPVKAENLFDEMVSRLESMQTESQRIMTIQLKPEFLGKVALELAMDAAGLHVKISAADSGVRAMINGQITALIESLENKGIEVVEVEVAYTGVDNGAFKENQDGQAQSNRQKRSKSEEDAADSITYYTALPIDTLEYYLDAGVSSVEYRA